MVRISLQEQHKAFILVHGRLRKQQHKHDKYANKNRKDISYNVGDPVYWEKHKREGKIDNYFYPYYRVIEKVSPVTYIIRNQLDGTTQSVHADHINWPRLISGRSLEHPQVNHARGLHMMYHHFLMIVILNLSIHNQRILERS